MILFSTERCNEASECPKSAQYGCHSAVASRRGTSGSAALSFSQKQSGDQDDDLVLSATSTVRRYIGRTQPQRSDEVALAKTPLHVIARTVKGRRKPCPETVEISERDSGKASAHAATCRMAEPLEDGKSSRLCTKKTSSLTENGLFSAPVLYTVERGHCVSVALCVRGDLLGSKEETSQKATRRRRRVSYLAGAPVTAQTQSFVQKRRGTQ